ncbi:Alpha/beta hydrolase family protein [Paramicrobacterium humi]|uniref:Alpha/beta hydrolase family protein n=1 Tax=Paramicrobacterium humi TaxID=640635 RepID=A0A1H4TEU2_9MICO|nr:alpha/beta hydrolase [Microbacterium humi]SEC54661.1 Alpha/beta hydrolase family protein [Microbacterium humi]
MRSLVWHRARLAAAWTLTVVLLVVIIALAWAHTVHMGERSAALEAWRNDAITISADDARIIMTPANGTTHEGLVFVPGARVDPYAYLAKLAGVAENGVTVIITKPVLNIALADQRPLSAFTAGIPGIDRWFVGGHSLGGVRACTLAADADGLILFGSYCATDVSATTVPVLSISASNDGLSTSQKIADARHLLPANARFVEIEGANHASFGDYGDQPGDGTATVGDDDVRSQITEAVLAFIEDS